jgi:hypothetical protein
MYHQMVLVSFFYIIKCGPSQTEIPPTNFKSQAYIFSWSWRGKMVSAAVLLMPLPLYPRREPKSSCPSALHSFVRIPVSKKRLTPIMTHALQPNLQN